MQTVTNSLQGSLAHDSFKKKNKSLDLHELFITRFVQKQTLISIRQLVKNNCENSF